MFAPQVDVADRERMLPSHLAQDEPQIAVAIEGVAELAEREISQLVLYRGIMA
jgi:hypothetical protein